jgi:hypothetical protein
MLLTNPAIAVSILLGSIVFFIAIMFLLFWREKAVRDHRLQLLQLEHQKKKEEEERQARDMERYDLGERQRREEEIELSKTAGMGTGGYIIVDLPDDQRPFFHDLLKGFEDYARLRGYTISFSIDASFSARIAFKFTLKNNIVNIAPEKVRAGLQRLC